MMINFDVGKGTRYRSPPPLNLSKGLAYYFLTCAPYAKLTFHISTMAATIVSFGGRAGGGICKSRAGTKEPGESGV